MSRCKCSKSDFKVNEQNVPYFENMTTKLQERRCDLVGRQKYLRDKITTMERSIPALMAYNMWMSGQKCDDPPYCKVREIMNKFSPYPDPTEKLLESLRKTVKELEGETAELHEKIIDTDVKLEEANMELESLELANKEMNDTLNNLEKELRDHTTPSLHSIYSEDLICLTKIRQLAKEELNLKYCIRELENKEVMFRDQMDRLLTSKDFQNICNRKKVFRCIQETEKSDKRVRCTSQIQKQKAYQLKQRRNQRENIPGDVNKNISGKVSDEIAKAQQNEKVKQEKSQETRAGKSSWISNWWKGNKKAPESTTEMTKVQKPTKEKEVTKSCISSTSPPVPCYEKLAKRTINNEVSKSGKSGFPCTTCKSRSCCAVLSPQIAVIGKSCSCNYTSTCNIPCKKLFGGSSKSQVTRSKIHICEPPPCIPSDIGFRQPCKTSTTCTALVRDLKNPCKIWQRPAPCKNLSQSQLPGRCRCNCKGKCSRGLSAVPCNCSAVPLCPSDKGYQPVAPLNKSLNSNLHGPESNSEEEFCECCSCGCDDSDVSLSCQCD